MSSDVNTWGLTCETWSSNCRLWSDCIDAVVEEVFGGARDPSFWHDPPFYDELEKYQQKYPHKKEILIKIYIKCANKKYNKTVILSEKKASVTVDDIKFILSTLKEVGVDIKNIKNYSDNNINNLLS